MKNFYQKMLYTIMLLLIKQTLKEKLEIDSSLVILILEILKPILRKYSCKFSDFVSLHFSGISLQKLSTFKKQTTLKIKQL